MNTENNSIDTTASARSAMGRRTFPNLVNVDGVIMQIMASSLEELNRKVLEALS